MAFNISFKNFQSITMLCFLLFACFSLRDEHRQMSTSIRTEISSVC
uniref:Uncharacterized protein n=1 Tax=Arundo donax TaxID=35708 RepID=A0A0A9GMZ2_ARUDO